MLKNNKITYLSILALFSLAAVLLTGCGRKKVKKKEYVLPVEVFRVVRSQGKLREVLVFSGDVEGEAMVQVFSPIPDRIKWIGVDVGDLVKKGQKLAVIEHTRLQQTVAQMEARLAAVRAQLAGAKVSLAGAKVALATAEREYRRLSRLLKSGAVSQQQVEMAKTQLESARTRYRAAQSQIAALQAQIRALRAGVAQAKTAKQNAIIRAPIDGLVARRYRQIGDMAAPQFPLFTLVKMDRVKVEIQLSERELAKVKPGMKAHIKVTAHPDRIFSGVITRIAPTLDLETRTAPARIEISNIYFQKPIKKCRNNSDCSVGPFNRCWEVQRGKRACAEVHPLKPGMIARVEIIVREKQNVLLVPSDAFLNDSFSMAKDSSAEGPRQMLVLVLRGKTPQRRKITVGISGPDGMTEVISGLKEGELVIVRGQNFYRPGVKIKIVGERRAKL